MIDRIYAKRTAAAAAQKTEHEAFLALQAIVADFDGFEDVSGPAARTAALGRKKEVRSAQKKDREDDSREQREIGEILAAENRLSLPEERQSALTLLRDLWKKLAATANGPEDTADRRRARRVTRGLAMGVAERVNDSVYRALLEQFRPPRPSLR